MGLLLCALLAALMRAAALRSPPLPPATAARVRLQVHRTEAVVSQVAQESLESILPRDKAATIVRELRADPRGLSGSRAKLESLLASAEDRLRQERRTLREIIGPAGVDRLLRLAAEADVYDSQAVRAFLQTGVVERMVGEVL